jgi:uncharacterized protein (DUF2147 family)
MKSSRLGCISAVALSALISPAFVGGTALADPKGLWQAQDGAIVRVTSCGQGVCAKLANTKSPIDPATGGAWTDKNNPDPAMRGRPLVGVQVFAMVPDGPGKWSGQLYNVDNGQTLPGHVVEIDPNTIRVEGCVGICGGQNMRRLQ